jgi:HK97 family phage portal protein
MDLMSKLQRYRVVADRPTRLGRAVEALRSYWQGPWSLADRELSGHFGPTHSTATGLSVTEYSALNYASVWAATNTISSDIGTFPLLHYKRLANGGKERLTNSPLYKLLHDAPNPEMTSVVWRRTIQAHALTWGNGYSEIERDAGNRPIAFWPLTPDCVTPFRAGADAPLQYHVRNPSGSETIIDAPNMIHVPGLGFNGTCGYSVIAQARESIGVGLAAEKFGATFFGNGATFGGVVSYKGPRPPELSDRNYVDGLKAKHQGVDRAHQLLALYNDATYARMGIPPNDAQFLETRQFQVNEVARWFNIPPHKIGELSRSTFSNIEQQTIDYYTTTLMPWIAVWEQELTAKLIPSLEKNQQFVQHLVDGLLRGDVISRSDAYTKQFQVGAITPNEIREAENRNKLPGGDRAFIQLNMVPLDRVDEIIQAELDAKKATKNIFAAGAPPTQTTPDPAQAKRIEELEQELRLARHTCQEAQDAEDVARQAETTATAALKKEQEDHLETLRISEARHVLVTSLTADNDQLKDNLSVMVARAERAEQDRVVVEATVAELRIQVTALTTDAAARQAALEAALAQATRLETERDAAQTAYAAADQARTTAQATLQGVREDLRGAVAYTVACLVQREADRARKAQASPEKLLKHVEYFYGTHGAFCREALRPVLRLVARLQGGDVTPLLDRVVPALLEDSTVQLRLVAADTDPETLAPALERVLRRWEAERGEAVADQLFREGNHDGR